MGAKSSGQIVKDPENRVGPDGLEPSPTRLRAGYAAANTSIPSWPEQKKPDVAVTPGFGGFLRIRPSVTSAESGWRAPFHFGNGPTDRHNALYPGIRV